MAMESLRLKEALEGKAAFPYSDLVETKSRCSQVEMEYELLDTGVFNEDRYFDIFSGRAKI
jgi:hypothetical protein